MKRKVFLINAGCGPLINEQDLADAQNSGKITGAGLDVLLLEPACINNPLRKAGSCYIRHILPGLFLNAQSLNAHSH